MRSRALFLASFAVLATALGSLPSIAGSAALAPRPQACSDPDRNVTLFAKRISPTKIGFGRSADRIKIPGPTIVANEGECIAVNLVNLTDTPVSAHPHGVDYTVASDGTPENRSCVPAGTSRTFMWQTHAPSTRTDGTMVPGSAGYWHYHDHCKGGPHGTRGIESGLYGALIVRRAGDPLPDRRFVVTFMNRTINNRKAPRTPVFTANEGERVEFVVIGHGDLFHTFHLHGHRWVDNRTGFPTGLADQTSVIDNKTLGPADSFGFQVVAGENVGPGAWMYHCHVQSHSDAGMTGLFLVRTPGGMVTRDAQAALDAWRRSHVGHTH